MRNVRTDPRGGGVPREPVQSRGGSRSAASPWRPRDRGAGPTDPTVVGARAGPGVREGEPGCGGDRDFDGIDGRHERGGAQGGRDRVPAETLLRCPPETADRARGLPASAASPGERGACGAGGDSRPQYADGAARRIGGVPEGGGPGATSSADGCVRADERVTRGGRGA